MFLLIIYFVFNSFLNTTLDQGLISGKKIDA